MQKTVAKLIIAYVLISVAISPAVAQKSIVDSASPEVSALKLDEVSPDTKSYFQDLLIRGTSAPLNEFLVFWGSTGVLENESAFFACELKEGGEFTAGPYSLLFEPNCKPNVLYSWGSERKLSSLLARLKDGVAWTGKANPAGKYDSAIFSSISPSSTFGYGPVLVRFKIKTGVRYQVRTFGSSPGEVSVRINSTAHDFAFEDLSVVESYSFGTPEIYDELVRDVRRFSSSKRVSSYIEYDPKRQFGLDRLWAQARDEKIQNEHVLKTRFLTLIRQILNGEGRIVFSRGFYEHRANYYRTDRSSYLILPN